MTNDGKIALMHALKQELLTFAGTHGDRVPLIAVSIVDTDPEPMAGPYLECSLAFKFLLPASPNI